MRDGAGGMEQIQVRDQGRERNWSDVLHEFAMQWLIVASPLGRSIAIVRRRKVIFRKERSRECFGGLLKPRQDKKQICGCVAS